MRHRSYIIRDELNGPQAMRFAETLSRSAAELDLVELSLRGATDIDVTGLAVLVRVCSQMQASGRSVVLTDASEGLRRRFAELGLSHMLAAPKRARRRFALPTFGRPRAYA